MVERRRHERKLPTNFYLVFDRENDRYIGRIVNMAVEGLMLASDEPFNSHDLLKCRITLPESILDRNEVEFDMRSRWIRKNPISEMFEAGFQIVKTSAVDKNVLTLLLRNWPTYNARQPALELV